MIISNPSMENTYFCPGKIITGKKRDWYLPYNATIPTKVYCEHCLSEYSYCIDETQFKLVNSPIYCCSLDKDFNDRSISISGIRMSILNPINHYRYKKTKSTNTTATFGLSHGEQYMIIIENYDKNTSKITVSDILHDNIENEYYDSTMNEDNFIIINSMSHGESLIFDEQKKNIINLKVIKWKKNMENGSSYLVMNGDPINFSIRLVKNENSLKEIRELAEYYNSIKDQNKKIIIVDDFIK